MITDPTSAFQLLVSTAVMNKYSDTSVVQVTELVAATMDEITGSSEQKLTAGLRPIHGFADDVNNQTIMLMLIERHWSKPPKLKLPLTTINTASFGKITPTFRAVDRVEDFAGEVPTPRSEIQPRLDELERLSMQVVRGMGERCVEEKALLLAHIFGSLIRIHPFADGNGRTARLFVYYALSCWRLPLFPIPKVRNDPDWKSALESAVAGDALKLKRELRRRMEDATKRP